MPEDLSYDRPAEKKKSLCAPAVPLRIGIKANPEAKDFVEKPPPVLGSTWPPKESLETKRKESHPKQTEQIEKTPCMGQPWDKAISKDLDVIAREPEVRAQLAIVESGTGPLTVAPSAAPVKNRSLASNGRQDH